MQYQLKTADSKKKHPAKGSAANNLKEKISLNLDSYIKVDASNEWNNFLSLINKQENKVILT